VRGCGSDHRVRLLVDIIGDGCVRWGVSGVLYL